MLISYLLNLLRKLSEKGGRRRLKIDYLKTLREVIDLIEFGRLLSDGAFNVFFRLKG